MSTLLFYFFLALGVSFICSVLESVILSVTHSHIGILVKDNHRSGIILQALKDINFTGYVTMELIPAVSDPFACVRGGRAEEFKDQYTELSIKHLKQIEEQLN